MATFFSRLNYSFGNEDWNTEEKALNIQPGDRVLCITASGDRPLHILTHDCGEVVSVDANPIQNHLLQLKAAAMQSFDFDHYMAFLGATQEKYRRSDLDLLARVMHPEAAKYWVNNSKSVDKGILYQGITERLMINIAIAIHFVRGKKVDRLFAIDDLEEQRQFLKSDWETRLWRKMFDICLNPVMTKAIIHDPGLYDNLGTFKPGAYIYHRLHRCLENDLARNNIMISLLFRGKVDSQAYPPYLTEKGFNTIVPRLNRLSHETNDIVSYIEQAPDRSFDCFSLSDVASYISQEKFLQMLKGIRRIAKPGARVCVRQFLSTHKIPDEINHWLVRDHALERELEQQDRCFVYRFLVGKVKN